ncbi:DUF3261 domain-containing protein [Streptomyces lasalocidi]|uniref:DUF3261 domain-containing protein n=1 Tax=Streptomyces lasalocidi TaxID=324833 RepID=A0A4U5W3V3_STRLS|nr:DUF3261 domain-containing protein [Streptomyces lasalocidi]TKS96094.1 DUF3261 domain-containing protein [Streptomyces lasalocidi]
MSLTAEQSVSVAVPAARQRRPRRSSVRHGQASCADYGCTRAECRQAALRARRRRNQDRARGRSARVPPHAAARWAARLRERGMSAQDIADRAGLSVTLVRRVLRTHTQDPMARDIARTSADAILGIPLPARRTPGAPGLTDSAEASRLLADLARAGWPATTLAQNLNVNARTIAEVRDKRPRLHLDLALQIRRLHRHLISLDPADYGIHPTTIARTRAAAARRTAATTV